MNAVDMDSLKLFEGRLNVQQMEAEDISYIGFDGERKSHSCEHMMNGYEAGFCDDNLFYLSAVDYKEHGGWTYSCSRHLPLSCFRFLGDIEDRRLNHEFDKWEDEEANKERELERKQKPQNCYICGSDGSEHNWESHVAEMKASANAEQ